MFSKCVTRLHILTGTPTQEAKCTFSKVVKRLKEGEITKCYINLIKKEIKILEQRISECSVLLMRHASNYPFILK
jgi:hypothetical protein